MTRMPQKQKIAVLTGAGVSAESGLSTYRDNGGMWDNYDPMVVASAEGWRKNPGLLLDFYNARRAQLKDVKPNEAHRLIASLEDSCNVKVITQNVDNLHERAGSSYVLHLHGELTKIRPEDSCNEEDGFSEKYVIDIGYNEVRLGDLAPDGTQYRHSFAGRHTPDSGHLSPGMAGGGALPLRRSGHTRLHNRPRVRARQRQAHNPHTQDRDGRHEGFCCNVEINCYLCDLDKKRR